MRSRPLRMLLGDEGAARRSSLFCHCSSPVFDGRDEPGCPIAAHRCDLDHAVRVEHDGGVMEIDSCALCRGAHQTADDGSVDMEGDPDGGLIRDSTGSGGRTLEESATRIRPPPAPAPAPAPDHRGEDGAALRDQAARTARQGDLEALSAHTSISGR